MRLALSDLNLAESTREMMRWCGGIIVEASGALLTAGPEAHPVMNVAQRLDPELDAAKFLDQTAEFFRSRGHSYLLMTRGHGDDDLAKRAQDAGLMLGGEPPAMFLHARLADRSPPEGSVVRPAVDARGVRDFVRVAREAWRTYQLSARITSRIFADERALLAPHIEVVVAYLDAQPVAGALLLLSHGIGGIYWVSTLPGARGRGYGEAVTRAVSNAGFDRGARFVTLQASELGQRIYERMGYVTDSRYRRFVCLESTSSE